MRIRITKSMQQAYQEALNDFREDIKAFCVKHGVDYVSISTENSIEKVLFSELLKAGIMA